MLDYFKIILFFDDNSFMASQKKQTADIQLQPVSGDSKYNIAVFTQNFAKLENKLKNGIGMPEKMSVFKEIITIAERDAGGGGENMDL